jgi:uncharacterized membrane protein
VSENGPSPINRTAALSYPFSVASGIVCLIVGRRYAFVRFHAWQSILLGVALVVAILALEQVPIVGFMMALGAAGLWVVATLFLAWRALRGHWSALPLIGDIAAERVPADSISSPSGSS